MEKQVNYQVSQKGYGLITLNRPNKRNAISQRMALQLKNELENAKKDKLKFLVLTAKGPMFSAGGDLTEFHHQLSEEEAYERLLMMKKVLDAIVHFPVPVIALLNGDALGGGCELATACDIRIAKEGSSFGFIQSNIGIVPSWGGGALLYRKVEPSFALDWLLTAKIFPANVLVERGWIHQMISKEDWTKLEVVLQPYINKSLKQMNLLKKQFIKNINTVELSQFMLEDVKNSASLWSSKEHIEAVEISEK